MNKKDKLAEEKKRQEEIRIVEAFWKKFKPELKRLRRVRNKQISSLMKIEKNKARGFLTKLQELGHIIAIADHKENCTWYFSNEAGFYEPEELHKLIPETELGRIFKVITGMKTTIKTFSQILYQDNNGVRGAELLKTIFAFYVEKGLVKMTDKGSQYSLTTLGGEFGMDEQSIKTLDAIALENEAVVKSEKQKTFPNSLTEVDKLLKEEIKEKMIVPVNAADFKVDEKHFSVAFFCEVLFGNQFTDTDLLLWILKRINPDISIASGLVQGNYIGYRVDKTRVLAEKSGFDKIGMQFHAADLFIKELEKLNKSKLVAVVQSDDDWDLSQSYSKLLQLSEGKVWSHGVIGADLTSEIKRRLNIVEFYKKWKIQWETIIPYEYRIGRSLMNSNEVEKLIGVKKSEYRLIMEILVAKRNKFEYPKEYEKIVDVEALVENKGKRVVTPNPIILTIGDREIQFVHNTTFSNITQYVDSLLPVEMVMRNLGARGETLPWIIADGQQERFYAHYLQGHWIMNLPGLQNPIISSKFRMKEFNTRILSSKSHRQNTFRKEPVTPGVVELEAFADGRLRFKLWNNKIKKILEEQKDQDEVKEAVCLLTDTQHGSITMQPEMEIKYMDYALFERKATRLYENGDILHGFIYPNHVAENRPYRLVSVDSQSRFTKMIQMPIIIDAPKLKDAYFWLGNHEWGIWGNSLTGENALYFLETYMQGIFDGLAKAGKPTDMQSSTISRIRWTKTHNPDGDKMLYPYFSTKLAGFKIAITHMWQPGGGGRTPVDWQRKWLRGMATTCGDIDVMFGGHLHSVWMAQEAEKWLIQLAASAGQSGYELVRGLMSTVMFTIAEFSNRDGITIEFVPWQFLQKYECQSPFLKGKDKELERPKPGTPAYRYGKMSPFIEDIIDKITQYMEV